MPSTNTLRSDTAERRTQSPMQTTRWLVGIQKWWQVRGRRRPQAWRAEYQVVEARGARSPARSARSVQGQTRPTGLTPAGGRRVWPADPTCLIAAGPIGAWSAIPVPACLSQEPRISTSHSDRGMLKSAGIGFFLGPARYFRSDVLNWARAGARTGPRSFRQSYAAAGQPRAAGRDSAVSAA